MTLVDAAYELLHAALDKEYAPQITPLPTARWWSLFRAMQRNHVAALCFDAAQKGGAPREVLLPWMGERQKAEQWYRYQKEVQDDLLHTFQQQGIRTMVLKGTKLAQLYPHEEWREFGDIDLFFYRQHREADEVAERQLGVSINRDSHHHTKYDYRGVTVESHFHLLVAQYPPSNRRYEHRLLQHIEEPTFDVLFQIRHMAGHFASDCITLRDLCDWALLCQARRDEVDWALVRRTLKDFGMLDFAASLEGIARQRLGLTLPTGLEPSAKQAVLEKDIVRGTLERSDDGCTGLGRLTWKIGRWRATRWKRRLVYSEGELALLVASVAAHATRPHSILHKV